jgi:hypothetical protein
MGTADAPLSIHLVGTCPVSTAERHIVFNFLFRACLGASRRRLKWKERIRTPILSMGARTVQAICVNHLEYSAHAQAVASEFFVCLASPNMSAKVGFALLKN